MQVKVAIRPGPFDRVGGPRVQVPRIASRPSPVCARPAVTDIHHQRFVPGRMSDHGEHGEQGLASPFVHPSEFEAATKDLSAMGSAFSRIR